MKKLLAYLKAWKTGENKLGACSESHYLLMLLMWLEEDLKQNGFEIELKLLEDSKRNVKDAFFKSKVDTTTLPVLVHVEEDDCGEKKKIEEYAVPRDNFQMLEDLEKLINHSKCLRCEEEYTPYSKLMKCLSKSPFSEKCYEDELHNINKRLCETDSDFLDGNDPNPGDFRLWPKLCKCEHIALNTIGYHTADAVKFPKLEKYMRAMKKFAERNITKSGMCPAMPDEMVYENVSRDLQQRRMSTKK